MKIGVLGGSFDPPHNGHLRIAEVAEERLGLDAVLFVPCSCHKLKGHAPLSPALHRAAMTALAVQSKINWLLETVELEKGGYSYTVDTLRYLRKKYRDAELFFIMGADSYEGFHLWKTPAKIRELATLAVFPRRSFGTKRADPRDIVLGMKKIDISSSSVREMIRNGKRPFRLLSGSVWEYIRKQSLYSSQTEA